MEKHGFITEFPRIVQAGALADGSFRVKGNIILGFTKDSNSVVGFSVDERRNCILCSLFFWKFDNFKCDLTDLRAIPVFATNGAIACSMNGLIVSYTDVSIDGLKGIVTGQNPSEMDQFLYFSLIFDEENVHNISFSCNNRDYRWNPHKCLLLNPIAVVANCVSSIKVMAVTGTSIKTSQWDVEGFLDRVLKPIAGSLEHYEVEIIDKSEERCSVIIDLGFIFYSQTKERWFSAVNIIEFPVNGQPVKQLHQESLSYEKRPQGNKIYEDLHYCMSMYSSLPKSTDPRIHFITNEPQPSDPEGLRVIKAPEWNLIIADEKNGAL